MLHLLLLYLTRYSSNVKNMIRNSLGLNLKVVWITLLCYRSSIDFQVSNLELEAFGMERRGENSLRKNPCLEHVALFENLWPSCEVYVKYSDDSKQLGTGSKSYLDHVALLQIFN
ncbi:hypothetical protein T12_3956 [Trichinella patagoniensis]|uniref:Uncharacterized protein n=1 Tax=Trichinella patagoniensis TaxID=990121 RepID=A0A0V1A8T8_9BILA|nr:hypothetical protein T12_3956 [Trichinella patagoniensis]